MGDIVKQILKSGPSGIVEQIDKMPVSIAEKTIDDIAHQKGDKFLGKVLDHLSPVKIAAILRQHDFSCPSIISWIMTPELIVNVLKIDPLFWKHIYNRNDPEIFIRIKNDALGLIASILLNEKSRDRQGAILQRISSDRLSRLYLFLPFIGWEIRENQTLEFEDSAIDPGTADHLYEMIRWAAPCVAGQIIDFVYSAETSLLYYITDLWTEVFTHFEKGRDFTSIENVMFLPID